MPARRPIPASRLWLEVDAQRGIHVSGDVLELARGTLVL